MLMHRMRVIVCLALGLALATGCGRETADSQGTVQTAAGDFRDLNGNGKLDPYEDGSLPLSERIEDILGRMSLEQKIHMVSGTGWSPDGHAAGIARVPGAAGYTFELEGLGVPSIVLVDGPAGVRIWPDREGDEETYHATAFPVATLLASSWDPELIRAVGAAMGTEVREYGADLLLAPGMNIHRNPLAGRNFEYYSEDPWLSGVMAAAMVTGVESTGAGATLKHFVANNQETNRYLIDTIVGERALREIYLRGFEIAVKKAQPWGIMTAYNQVNGAPASQDEPLVTTVLRDEWGFDGVVMSDWFAGDDPVAQMQAGTGLLMPGTAEGTAALERAVRAGDLEEATLDRNIRGILGVVLQSPSFAVYQYSDQPDLKAHAETARTAAAEGVVLLKNSDRALPLPGDVKNIAAFGNTSYDFLSGGSGSGDVNEAYTVSLVQGLEGRGFVVDPDLRSRYEDFIRREKAKLPEKKSFFDLQPPIPEMEVPEDMVAGTAAVADIAFITIGRNSGEFQDRTMEGDFLLTDAERTLIETVSGAFHAEGKKVVLILNVGNVVETVSWRADVDAIVLPWQGGQEAGNALTDVLTGRVNPSGRLPTTFPVEYTDVPSSDNFPGVETSDEPVVIAGILTAKHSRVEYEEGIYVGYRYYDSFDVEPAYEFGYGLSYTDFAYGDVRLSRETFDDSLTATVTVTNTGSVAGREVGQLYLTAPDGGLPKPAKELKGFAKTRKLAPGESQDLEFTLDAASLASFDPDRSAWIADAGTYKVNVGASSRDLRSAATFDLRREIVVEKTLADLSPERRLEELARIRHRFRGKIGQSFVRTRDFPIERNTRVYFRVRKIRCADKGQARAREIGDGYGLDGRNGS
jgi:beta-glucosidase